MKFTSKIAAVLASALVLGACSGNNNGNVLASIDPETQIMAEDVYTELLKSNSGKSAVYQYIIKEIVEQNFPVTDAMETEAKLTVEQIKTSYTSMYGSQADAYLANTLQQYGFKDLDDYQETMIYSFQLKEFLGKYIEENFDKVFEDYYITKNPRYVSHVLIKMADPDNPTDEEKEKLNKVQTLINDGVDFAQIAKDYSDDSTASNGGELGICDADTNFVTEFKTVALSLKEGEISPATKSDYGYHFIMVTSTDKEIMKADEQVIEERLPAYDNYMIYLAAQSYELDFANETIQDIFNTQLQASLTARENSRKGS